MGVIRISAHWCGIRLARRPADKKGGGLLANIKPPSSSGGRGPVGVPTSCLTVRSFTRATTIGLLILVMMLLSPRPLPAAPVPVRFAEGITHGFLLLRTVDGALLASGDLLQVGRGGGIESRMVFHFKDGSLFDETVVFTQQHVFTMQSYRLVQRGPVFTEDTEILLERSGKYRVKTKAHKDGREEVLTGTLELPPDVYNGMILTVVKNLPKGAGETVHMVAFTPKPLLIQLELAPKGEHKVLIGELSKTAIHYVFKPQLGSLAQPLRHAARAHAAGLPGLDHYRRGAGLCQVRGTALHDGTDLADRADEPPLAELTKARPQWTIT